MNDWLKHPLAGLVASAVLLTGILGYMVIDRVRLLKAGREIVLPIRPVDPRDIFKGDYAALGYDISRIDNALLPAEPARLNGERVFVTLQRDEAGVWKPIAAAFKKPQTVADNQVVIAGFATRYANVAGGFTFVRYGLERYFVPEGTGKRIEDLARTSTMSAIVAVAANGQAAIKGLVIDGKNVYEEPLF